MGKALFIEPPMDEAGVAGWVTSDELSEAGRFVPGEPPLVGHFVPGIGHKHFGYLVRNFDKLILCVPIIKILQIDCSHK